VGERCSPINGNGGKGAHDGIGRSWTGLSALECEAEGSLPPTRLA
jgi:hypothetical protein